MFRNCGFIQLLSLNMDISKIKMTIRHRDVSYHWDKYCSTVGMKRIGLC